MVEAETPQLQPGTLYLVSTPIGNLEDITLRALRVLREVDLVAAEDTRHTRKLLSAHGIQACLLSYREHNHEAAARKVLGLLAEGKRVACVSDAGTPGLNDPGGRLVARVLEAGLPVVPVPGASALLAALVASGLDCSSFLFLGFPARRQEQLRRQLRGLHRLPVTLAWYESAKRLADTLAVMAEMLGPRPAVVARELTKLHEQFVRGDLEQLAVRFAGREVRGEIVLLVAGAEPRENRFELGPELAELAAAALLGERLGTSRVAGLLSRLTGRERRELYAWLNQLREERQR